MIYAFLSLVTAFACWVLWPDYPRLVVGVYLFGPFAVAVYAVESAYKVTSFLDAVTVLRNPELAKLDRMGGMSPEQIEAFEGAANGLTIKGRLYSWAWIRQYLKSCVHYHPNLPPIGKDEKTRAFVAHYMTSRDWVRYRRGEVYEWTEKWRPELALDALGLN